MAVAHLAEALREYFFSQHLAHDVEIRNGEIVVVSPHDFISSNIVVRLAARMTVFVEERNLGYVVESNAGFRYDDGDLLAPDLAFVSRERLPVAPRSFANVVPEIVIEVQSSTQRPSAVRAKLALLLEKGSTLGVYIDPDQHTVEVHRPNHPRTTLTDGDMLTFDGILPGLSIEVISLWPRLT